MFDINSALSEMVGRSMLGAPKPAETTDEQITTAGAILAKAKARLIGARHGVDYVGIWKDSDSPELRAAIAVFHPDGIAVRYMDDDEVPMKYKLRLVPKPEGNGPLNAIGGTNHQTTTNGKRKLPF